jgi:hypothetical protein
VQCTISSITPSRPTLMLYKYKYRRRMPAGYESYERMRLRFQERWGRGPISSRRRRGVASDAGLLLILYNKYIDSIEKGTKQAYLPHNAICLHSSNSRTDRASRSFSMPLLRCVLSPYFAFLARMGQFHANGLQAVATNRQVSGYTPKTNPIALMISTTGSSSRSCLSPRSSTASLLLMFSVAHLMHHAHHLLTTRPIPFHH